MTVLVVDPSSHTRAQLCATLEDLATIVTAERGQDALAVLRDTRVDLVIADALMGPMDGFDLLRSVRVQRECALVPVILLAESTDTLLEERALAMGAVDWFVKPLRAAVVHSRVRTLLELERARADLQRRNHALEAELAYRTRESDFIRDVTVLALANLADVRDPETGNHLHRTQEYVRILARALRSHPRFRAALGQGRDELVTLAAPLHDIGKVAVPDHVLHKPGRLSADEFAVMQRHTTLGAAAIEHAVSHAEREMPFFTVAREVVRSHHERWDGSGYPDRLHADAIPVSARIMAVSDVFDALTSARVYKQALAVDEAIDAMRRGRATHFDPAIIDAFDDNIDEFVAVMQRFADSEEARDARALRTRDADQSGVVLAFDAARMRAARAR